MVIVALTFTNCQFNGKHMHLLHLGVLSLTGSCPKHRHIICLLLKSFACKQKKIKVDEELVHCSLQAS